MAAEKEKKKSKWMKKAFSNAHGQFRAKAEKAGETTREFAHEVLGDGSHASTKTKRQAALAERGMEAHHGKTRAQKHQDKMYGSK